MCCLLFFSSYKAPRKPMPIVFSLPSDRCPRKLALVGNELLRKPTCFFLVNECGRKLLLPSDDYAKKSTPNVLLHFLVMSVQKTTMPTNLWRVW
jgi:hypothetical protein